MIGCDATVLPSRSDRRISANCLIVLMAFLSFVPCIDPDVSRRNPAMIFEIISPPAVAVAATSGTLISNLPKIRLLFVRRSINDLRMVGIDAFERIFWSVVMSLVESIGTMDG